MKLGTLKYGEVKKFTVKYVNTSKVDFKPFFVQGSCTCTKPLDYSKLVKPGETGFIQFEFNTNEASVKKAYNSGLEITGNVKDQMILYEIEVDIVE